MRTLPLGHGGRPVSVIGYGGMHLSVDGRPPETEAIRTIHASLDVGVTLIDTADVYCLNQTEIGHNERLIAKALGSWPGARERVLVATKGGMIRPEGRWERDARPERLQRACERSLKALGVERIGLYQLHAPDHQVPFADSVGAMADMRRAGWIDQVGLSNVTVDQIKEAEQIVPIASVQNRLNPFFREAISEGVAAYCGARNITFLAYSPTGGGRLTRKIPQIPAARAVAERRGISPHQAVLLWVLAQGATVVAIPSSRTVAHAVDGARTASLTLDPSDLAELDRAEWSRA